MSDVDEVESARRAAVRYREPASLGDPRGRHRRDPDPTPLTTSYATQLYLLDVRILRPLPDVVPEPALDGGVRWVLTGWNPGGAATTMRAQERAQSLLRAEVVLAGGRVVADGVTSAPDRAWVEDHLLVEGLVAAAAVRLGRAAGQPAVVALAGDVLTVVPTGLRPDVERTSRRFVVEAAPTTCPMRTDGVRGARCVARGGPWISASIHAAVLWRAHRRLLLEPFGCAPCATGDLPILGPFPGPTGAIGMTELTLPSRYGGWAWA